MSYFNSVASTMNYFNNLITNQIAQNNMSNSIAQAQGNKSTAATQQISPALSNALNSLAGMLNSGAANVTDASNIGYTVDKLVDAGASNESIQNLLTSLSGDTGDIVYTRTGSNDPNITLQNRVSSFGGDLQSFLSQATQVAQRGGDINKYINTASNVVAKGDYDDLRRFISVTGTVMARNQDLGKFYDFTNNILDKRHYDMESNIFSVQTMLNQGASLDTAIAIMSNMENTGLNGRNNMVDLNRFSIDARNKGMYLPYMLQQMANSGDSRAFMDSYMAANGMKTTAPDFNKYKRIERIDGEDMVIQQGESAALFAQAISSYDGLLPESVLYWSSMQTGAMSHGSSYLDLSKLAAGTYDIYVKIGNYAGGTDTAKKRVVVLPNETEENHEDDNHVEENHEDDNHVEENHKDDNHVEENHKDDNHVEENHKDDNHGHNKTEGTTVPTSPVTTPPITIAPVEPEKVENNNGLGDTKDVDNKVKFIDESNPGQSKFNAIRDGSDIEVPQLPNWTPVTNSAPASILNTFKAEASSLFKLESLGNIFKQCIKPGDIYDFLDNKIGKGKICDFLSDIGHSGLAKKYEKQAVKWFDMLLAIGRDSDFFRKSCDQYRFHCDKEETRKFFNRKELGNEGTNNAIKLIGFDDDKVKSNNGLGDTNDLDNIFKFIDNSNPGHNKTDVPTIPVNNNSADNAEKK